MINIAILGLGVVGKGTADLLSENRKLIGNRLGEEINIKYILDLREFPGTPYEKLIVHDFNTILNDDSVVLVAEMMGGAHPAYEFTKSCLSAGKSVVTSNKEVVATFGANLLEIARANGVSYGFEASVGGGIPIIRPIVSDFLSNEITGIDGILNGTTNYILTEMQEKGKAYSDALAEAQEKGYAEKDPSADVDGIDTCRKLCILTALASGVMPDANDVLTVGIRGIEKEDVELLEENGYAVKLLGRIVVKSGKPCCIIAPFVCANSSPLAHVNGVFNGIVVRSSALGETMFYGRGAGAEPTAGAVCTDIVSILRDGKDSFAPVFAASTEATALPSSQFESKRYIRCDKSESELTELLGALCKVGNAYITEKAFSESEFDSLVPNIGLISSLRVL